MAIGTEQRRINRPDTWQHPTTLHKRQNNPCQMGAVHTWLKADGSTVSAIRPLYGDKRTFQAFSSAFVKHNLPSLFTFSALKKKNQSPKRRLKKTRTKNGP